MAADWVGIPGDNARTRDLFRHVGAALLGQWLLFLNIARVGNCATIGLGEGLHGSRASLLAAARSRNSSLLSPALRAGERVARNQTTTVHGLSVTHAPGSGCPLLRGNSHNGDGSKGYNLKKKF